MWAIRAQAAQTYTSRDERTQDINPFSVGKIGTGEEDDNVEEKTLAKFHTEGVEVRGSMADRLHSARRETARVFREHQASVLRLLDEAIGFVKKAEDEGAELRKENRTLRTRLANAKTEALIVPHSLPMPPPSTPVASHRQESVEPPPLLLPDYDSSQDTPRDNAAGPQGTIEDRGKLEDAPEVLSEEPEEKKVHNYEVCRVWQAFQRGSEKTTLFARDSFAASLQRTSTLAIRQVDVFVDADGCLARYVASPYSTQRAVWDVMSLLLILYDMIFIPLDMFDLPDTTFFVFMNWTTRLFWTADFAASMLTGYATDAGGMEMRVKKIWWKYATTWMPLDVTVVGTDWIVTLIASGAHMGYAQLGKAGRTLRIMRVVRLARIARLKKVYTMITDRISSEKLLVTASILKSMVVILALSHIVACGWWGVGSADDPDSNWVDTYNYRNRSFGYSYTTTLQWSLSNFAGGPIGDMTAQNFNERFFATVVLALFFVGSVVFVSNLTSSMTQLHIIGSDESQRFAVLRQYLAQNNISKQLALRVTRNARHSLHEEQRLMPEARVSLLAVVSEPLRAEIHFEVYSPILAQHSFFHRCMAECPGMMHRICHTCVGMLAVSNGDIVFRNGEIPSPPTVYVVGTGSMRYNSDTQDEEVPERRWIAEACLWTRWVHSGELTASTDCRLFFLNVRIFHEVMTHYNHITVDAYGYAKAFVEMLNSCPSPSDLFDNREVFRPKADKATFLMDTLGEARRRVSHIAAPRASFLAARGSLRSPRGRSSFAAPHAVTGRSVPAPTSLLLE